MLTFLRAWRSRSERGASAVEYGLLVVGVALVLVITVPALGDTLQGIFEYHTNDMCANCSVTPSP